MVIQLEVAVRITALVLTFLVAAGIGSAFGAWTLVCRGGQCPAVEILDEPASRPPDFDLAAFWAESSAGLVANLPRYPITVRVSPEVVRRLWIPGAYARVEHVCEPEADGWHTANLLLQTEYEACSYVLGFGPRMEVVAPPELRERVVREAASIVAFYGERTGAGTENGCTS